MSIYDADWREVPRGYYADYGIKQEYEQRRAENQRMVRQINTELEKMGYEPELVFDERILDEAERRAKRVLRID
jgi:predicted adenine nucleotide alpha hydrolase (AANH) superfamily ATPase